MPRRARVIVAGFPDKSEPEVKARSCYGCRKRFEPSEGNRDRSINAVICLSWPAFPKTFPFPTQLPLPAPAKTAQTRS